MCAYNYNLDIFRFLDNALSWRDLFSVLILKNILDRKNNVFILSPQSICDESCNNLAKYPLHVNKLSELILLKICSSWCIHFSVGFSKPPSDRWFTQVKDSRLELEKDAAASWFLICGKASSLVGVEHQRQCLISSKYHDYIVCSLDSHYTSLSCAYVFLGNCDLIAALLSFSTWF